MGKLKLITPLALALGLGTALADTVTFFVEPVQGKLFLKQHKPNSSQVVPWFMSTAQGMEITCTERRRQVNVANYAQANRVTIVYEGLWQNLPEGSAQKEVVVNKVNLNNSIFAKNKFAWQVNNALVYVVNAQDQQKLYHACKIVFLKQANVSIANASPSTVEIKDFTYPNQIPNPTQDELKKASFALCTARPQGEQQAQVYLTYNGQKYVPHALVFQDEQGVEHWCETLTS